VKTLVMQDPQAAAKWVNTVSDAAQREEWTRLVVQQWSGEDRAAAEQWLNGLTLSEEQKRSLLEPPKDETVFRPPRIRFPSGRFRPPRWY
jgi:hypothetical protein